MSYYLNKKEGLIMEQRKAKPVEQQVAAEILVQFMFTRTMDEVTDTWTRVFEQYGLHDDPFTGCPCTDKEYADNILEHSKQAMMEKYGHCDGLE